MDTSNKALRINRVTDAHLVGKKYSSEKRIEVVTKFLVLGNMRLVAELTGVSYGLIRLWKTQEWWADLEAEIRCARDMKVDNKLSRIVDLSLEMVADRLENGDVFLDRKTGEVGRKPIALGTAHRIAQDSLTQQIALSKKTVHENTAQQAQSVADQIKLLANEFAKFNTNRTISVQAKDITDAVYDERETRLQETVREVRWSPESDQSTLGAESSESGDGTEWPSTQGGREGRGSQDAFVEGWEPDSEEQPPSGESNEQSFIRP